MRKQLLRLGIGFVVCLAVCLGAHIAPARAAAPRVHALLVSSENYVSLLSLAPSTSNNVYTLTKVLTQMSDSLVGLRTEVDTIGTQAQLADAIQAAFAAAQPGDICLLYISGHGRYRPEAPEYPAVLILSNGTEEVEITGAQLQGMLDGIPGMKFVLLDACNSGAMMGKGVTPNLNDTPILPLHGDDYKVLTSAGGNEISWNWNMEQNSLLSQGSSYFANALAIGLGLYGQYGADLNRDGDITLDEVHRFLLANHGSSTTHVYPQEDDFVLFRHNPRASATQAAPAPLSSIAFSSDVLSPEHPEIDFSFTVHEPVRLQYQLVFSQNGAWDWKDTQFLLDTYESDAETDASDGTVSPGRKRRVITLSDIAQRAYGYVLLQIMTLNEGIPKVFFSKLLTVMPQEGDPKLRIDAFGEEFALLDGDELAMQVIHEFPVQLTVGIYDASGRLLRRLATEQTSRPLHLMPEGSLFYWDGCDTQGVRVPPGFYTLRATARVDGAPFETATEIELLN